MTSAPETRPSLLVRVRDPADRAAWQEFVEIYRPVILRLAQRKGMQAADAEDIAQEVLSVVAKAVEQWEHDPQRARFRTWLHRVANNAILNALSRGKPDRGAGGPALQAALDQKESRNRPRFGPFAAGVSPGSVSLGRPASPQRVPPGHLGRVLADRCRRTVRGCCGERTRQRRRGCLHRAQPRHATNPGESKAV